MAEERDGAATSGVSEASAQPPTEYDLAIDAQVEKFVETKQKLTYFLITASVAVIAFVVDFFVKNLRVKGRFTATSLEKSLVITASLAGLAAAGVSLLNLRLEHRSYSLHLHHRYRRKGWESLTTEEQARWDKLTRWAGRFLSAAFLLLFLEIALAVIFFIAFFR